MRVYIVLIVLGTILSLSKVVYVRSHIFYPDPTKNVDYLVEEVQDCFLYDKCKNPSSLIRRLISAVAAEYTDLLLPEIAIATFLELFKFSHDSPQLTSWLSHAISSVHFANGDLVEAKKYWASMNLSDVVCFRSFAIQKYFYHQEHVGIEILNFYRKELFTSFTKTLRSIDSHIISFNESQFMSQKTSNYFENEGFWRLHSQSSETQTEDNFIEFLLSELYGLQTTESYYQYINNQQQPSTSSATSYYMSRGVTGHSLLDDSSKELADDRPPIRRIYNFTGRLSDAVSQVSHFRANLRDIPKLGREFRSTSSPYRLFLLSVLSKLGLLPLGTVVASLLAPLTSPWEAKRYRLLALLGYMTGVDSVMSSLRQLVMASDRLEKICEEILSGQPSTAMMFGSSNSFEKKRPSQPLSFCNSYGEIAVLLQILPLVSYMGISWPRPLVSLGHTSVPLVSLLSEVYISTCGSTIFTLAPPSEIHLNSNDQGQETYYNRSSVNENIDGTDIQNIDDTTNNDSRSSRTGTTSSTPIKARINVGVVSGSIDTYIGHVVVGLLDTLSARYRWSNNVDQTNNNNSNNSNSSSSSSQHPRTLHLTSLCFPTVRDALTDRFSMLFHESANLPTTAITAANAKGSTSSGSSSGNSNSNSNGNSLGVDSSRGTAIERVKSRNLDVILFTDPLADPRVFAMAHERLAPIQIALWGSGSTTTIASIDYYLVPDAFYSHAIRRHSCPTYNINKYSIPSNMQGGAGNSKHASIDNIIMKHPSSLYSEQIILLEGIPPLFSKPQPPPKKDANKDINTNSNSNDKHSWKQLYSDEERIKTTKSDFREESSDVLLSNSNAPGSKSLPAIFSAVLHGNLDSSYSRFLILPVTVRQVHPEFDKAIELILKRDLSVMIFVVTLKRGRDNIPINHAVAIHDITHPATSNSMIHTFLTRLKPLLGQHLNRIRVLPPLEEPQFRLIMRRSIAVLDPFPVGLDFAVMMATEEHVAVITAPLLQECTHSFAHSILQYYNDYHHNNNTITHKAVKPSRFNTDHLPDSNPHKNLQKNVPGSATTHTGEDDDFSLIEDEDEYKGEEAEEVDTTLTSATTVEEYAFEALQYQKKYNTYSSGTNFKVYNSRISTSYTFNTKPATRSKTSINSSSSKDLSHGDQFAELVIKLYASLN